MNVDINKIHQKNLEKITKALDDSNFRLSLNLSSDLIRISDYVDYADGVFIGEFFESLFLNLDHINRQYIIEENTLKNLKEDIINLISIIKNSLSPSGKKKADIYDLMTKIRATATRLQIETARGEKIRKKIKESPELSDNIEEDIKREFITLNT